MVLIIRSRAPLRISFAGGGTDVDPYPKMKGGATLSTTIDRYAYVTLEKNSAKQILLKSDDYGLLETIESISKISKKGKLNLLKATIKSFKLKNRYFKATISVDAPPGSGLGSSSAVTVSLLGALLLMIKKNLSNYEIAEKAYNIERVDLGINGGRQDQYASTFGGFNLIEYQARKVNVTPLRIKKEILNEFLASLVLCDTGITRLSANILKRQVKKYEKNEENIIEVLDGMKKEAYEVKDQLTRGNIFQIGEILNEGWEFKKKIDPMMTNKKIDKIYSNAINMGAIGGKLLGAGAGGHCLFLCEPNKKINVVKKLLKIGCKLVKFNFDEDGLQTWSLNNGKVEV